MRLHELKPAAGSHRDRKRLGRGNATGQGTTAGKGTKGEKARSGGLRSGFRGMSSRNARVAKRRGFNNPNKIIYQVINLSDLASIEAGSTLDPQGLVAAGLVSGTKRPAKILGKGEISVPIHVSGIAVSGSARAKIEAAGGSVATDEGTEAAPSSPAQAQSAEAAPATQAPAQQPAEAEPTAEPTEEPAASEPVA